VLKRYALFAWRTPVDHDWLGGWDHFIDSYDHPGDAAAKGETLTQKFPKAPKMGWADSYQVVDLDTGERLAQVAVVGR
jgi:hypothetical protein